MLIFALSLPALTLFTAGAIDLMSVSSARGRIHDIGDAAALAGATELSLAIDDNVVISRAHAFVEAHVTDWKRARKSPGT